MNRLVEKCGNFYFCGEMHINKEVFLMCTSKQFRVSMFLHLISVSLYPLVN